MAAREEKLLDRERGIIKRERAFIGRRMALADTAKNLKDREADLHKLAVELGDDPTGVAKLTAPRPDPFTEGGTLGYRDLEVAREARITALEIREDSMVTRLDALASRATGIEQSEKALEYQEELYHVRGEELERMGEVVAAVERGEAPEALPEASALAGRPTLPTDGWDDLEVPSVKTDPALRARTRPDASPESIIADPFNNEKRRQPRYGLKVYVGLESEHNFFTGFSRNISAGGIFIATHDMLDVGREVELLFQLPSGEPVHTQGRVAWIREYNPDNSEVLPGIGVHFIDLSQAHQEAVTAFLTDREPLLFDEEG
jgi:uncharacterized protein (TIGR02266 family)